MCPKRLNTRINRLSIDKNVMQPKNSGDRDFSTISPSARLLLMLKGATDIPFARQAAELISATGEQTSYDGIKDLDFWTATVHFEKRYKSIDQLLYGLPGKNILELASGFSFRGINAVQQNCLYYIDTDLPDIINVKKEIAAALGPVAVAAGSCLEMLPLNALDGEQFGEVTDRFPVGAVNVINEGLLVYLNRDEKEKLCSLIHGLLKKRGGYWVTADIYIKKSGRSISLNKNGEMRQFFDLHHIEDNKFESFKEAESFFNRAGFVIEREAETDNSKITALKYLLASATDQQLAELRKAARTHTTWRLKVK